MSLTWTFCYLCLSTWYSLWGRFPHDISKTIVEKKTCILIRSTSSPLNFHFWSRTERCLDTKSPSKSWNREGSNCWCRAVNTLLLGPDVACSFQFALLPQDVTRNGQHNCQNFIMAKSRGFNFYRFLHLDCLEFSLNK